MSVDPRTFSRVGAWGQICAIALAIVCWYLEMSAGFIGASLGYLVVTMVGIAGIARTESAIAGPIIYPFIVPGFVPLYYFATRQRP